MNDQKRELFRFVEATLLRCWVIGFILMGLMLVATQLAHGVIVDLHGSMFGLSPHEIDLILYCAMGLVKLGVIVCFFIPWLALKLTLSSGARAAHGH